MKLLVTSQCKRLYKEAQKHPGISLFLLAVLVHIILLIFLPLPDQSGGDLSYYSDIAFSILEGEGVGGARHAAPGQSIWLAVVYLFSSLPPAIVAAQIILSGLLAVGVYKLGAYAFGKRVGLLAGIAAVLWPALIIQTFEYGKSILLYTTLLTFGLYYFYRAVRETDWQAALMAGVLLAFAALTDVIGLLVPVVLCGWALLVALTKRENYHSSLKGISMITVTFLIAFLLPVSAWGYYNKVVMPEYDHPPIITKQAETKLIANSDTRKQTLDKLQEDNLWIMTETARKMFVLPYNLSVFEDSSEISYKQTLYQLLSGEPTDLSTQQKTIMLAKVLITILHILLLVSVVVAVRKEYKHDFTWLTALLTAYVFLVTSVFAAFKGGDFKALSPAESFLIPLLPLFIILATRLFTSKLASSSGE